MVNYVLYSMTTVYVLGLQYIESSHYARIAYSDALVLVLSALLLVLVVALAQQSVVHRQGGSISECIL